MSDDTVIGTCFHCRAPCTEEDYCFGCQTLVCAQCSPYYDGPDGFNHKPEEHLLYFKPMGDGEFTCRRRLGGPDQFCGKPAVHSAYCVEHLHEVIDERLRAGDSS